MKPVRCRLLGSQGALFLLTSIFCAQVSSSQNASDSTNTKIKVVYEKKTKIDFEQKSIDSQFLSPDGMAVKGDQNLDFDSLLEPKKNFRKELNRGARAVR